MAPRKNPVATLDISPDQLEAYSIRVELAGGTWARMWLPSPADFRAMRSGGESDEPDAQVADMDRTFQILNAACIELHGPKPGPVDEQPVRWLFDLLAGWLGTKDGGLPPESAAS